MAVRNESVRLSLDDGGFSTKMAKDAAATAVLARELDKLDHHSSSTSKSTDKLDRSLTTLRGDASKTGAEVERLSDRGVNNLGRNTEQSGNQIDRLSGRLALFAQAAIAVGPPLAAVGVGGLAAMATQATVAGAAIGVTVLAFHGMGTALKALNEYQLQPSQANFEKLQESMRGLGPQAQAFVGYLQSIRPELGRLRQDAQNGLLPGAQEGLEQLMRLMPQAEHIIGHVATTVGDLLAEAGDNLNDPRWVRFFNYLDDEARPILLDMGRASGDVAEGMANMLMAFDPVTQGFSTGLLRMARDFRDWSAGLADSNGFHEFVDYIEANGPRVLETVGSLANAFLQVAEAAAPLAGPTLATIRAVADVLAAVADSPIGPPLIAAAIAVSTLGRAFDVLRRSALTGRGEGVLGQALGTRLDLTSIRGAVAATREATVAATELTAAERAAGLAHARYIGSLRASSVGMELMPTAAPSKGATQSAEALVAANNRVAQASERVSVAEERKSASIRRTAATYGRAAALAGGLAIATTGVADSMHLSNTASLGLMGSLVGTGGLGIALGAATGLALDFAHANDNLQDSIRSADFALVSGDVDKMRASYAQLKATVADDGWMSKTAGVFTEAWHQISGADSISAQAQALGRLSELKIAMRDAKEPDGLPDLLGNGIKGLGLTKAQLHAAAESADEFRRSLVAVNALLEERGSFRAYQAALDDFGSTLKKNGKHFHEFGEAGRANNAALDAIAASATQYSEKLKGMDKIRFLAGARKQFIDAATAMGYPLAAAQRLADRLHLLGKQHPKPKVDADTGAADKKLTASQKKAAAFQRTYQAVLDARDSSSPKAQAAARRALAFAKRYAATLDASDPAMPVIRAAIAALQDYDGRHATATLETVHVNTFIQHGKSANPGGQADGGLWLNGAQRFADGGMTQSGRYVPRVSQFAKGGSNILWAEPETGEGEVYLSLKPSMRDRNRDLWRMAGDELGMDWEEYANGGLTRLASGGGNASSARKQREHESAAAHKRQLHAIAMVSHELTKLSDKLKTVRQARTEYQGTVSQAYVSDPFGGTLGGFNSQIAHETKTIRGAQTDLNTLRAHGLNGALYKDLAASGNATLIDQFAHLTKAQIAAEEKAYNTHNRVDTAIGRNAATDVYGKEVTKLTGEVRHLSKELHALRTGHHIGNTTIQRQINKMNGVTKQKQAAHRAKHA